MRIRTIAIIISLLFLPLVVAAQGNIDPPPINKPHKPRPPKPKPKPKPTQQPTQQPTPTPPPKPADKIEYDSYTNEIVYGSHRYTMVYVDGGTFKMGATPEQDSKGRDELPVHSVTLSSFYIGKTEVPQWLWKAVMGYNNPSYFNGDNLPVEMVTWDDCQRFLKKLNSLTGMNFKLPTEAQWEFAARGGIHSKGYQYSGSHVAGNVAWYDVNSKGKTHDVGLKNSNELGLYDMSGNVFEWCQDWLGEYTDSSVTNPKGPNSGTARVFRGGYWEWNISHCRVSNRNSISPTTISNGIGFRLAM